MFEALAKSLKLREEVNHEKDAEKISEEDINTDDASEFEKKEEKKDGKLVIEEEIEEGHISLESGTSSQRFLR